MRKIILLIILLFCSTIYAQFDYSINPIVAFTPSVNDARARSLGRTELVTTFGANAIFTNPANLCLRDDNSVQIGGRLIGGWINDDSNNLSNHNYELSESYPIYFKASQFACVLTHHNSDSGRNISLGLGVSTYLDWAMKSKSERYYRDDDYTSDSKTTNNGGIRTLSIALAAKLNDRIAIGAGLHKSLKSRYNSKDDNHNLDIRGQQSSSDREFGYYFDTFFSTISTSIQLTETVMFAFMIKPEYCYKSNHYYYKHEFYYGMEYIYHDYRTIKANIPTTYGAGLSYETDQAILAFEYDNRPFHDCKLDTYLNRANLFDDTENGHSIRMGLEYKSKYPIRMGFFSEAIPIISDELTDNSPAYLIGFTAGTAVSFKKIIADIYAEYSFWETTETFYNGSTYERYTRKEDFINVGITLTGIIPNISLIN